MSETINQRIALYRKLANLTQTEAAEKMGMKCSTYSQMERKGSISAERLLALADIFGVKPDVLLYDTKFQSPGQVNFLSNESATGSQLRQSVPFSDTNFGPSPFIVTHKEESIIKILRNLPKSDYDEIIGLINQKYKESKNR